MSSRLPRFGSARRSATSAAQELADLGVATLQRLERVGPAEAAGEQDPQLQQWRGGLGEQFGEQRAQPCDAHGITHAEDDPHDHLERQRLHARVDREGLAGRPAVDLASRKLRDDRLVSAHPLAVEGGKHQPPPREVLVALEQQDRPGPHYGFEADGAPRGQAVLAPPVQRSDRLGVRQHHHRRLEADEVTLNASPWLSPARVHELDRAKQPVQGLDGRGRCWSGGERHVHLQHARKGGNWPKRTSGHAQTW